MRERGMNHRVQNTRAGWHALAGACVLGWGLLGCGADIEGADVDELEEGEDVSYGQSEQALRRLNADLGAGTTGVFEPGDPPPPPPPPDPCKSDPRSDLRAALGFQVLNAFGRTDPGVWECLPSLVAGCPAVRLSPPLRQSAITSGLEANVTQIEELLGALTELDGMTAFAQTIEAARTECSTKGCSTARRNYVFGTGTLNECDEIVFSVDAPVRSGPAAEVAGGLDSRAVLAQATPAPAPTTTPIKALGTASLSSFSVSSRATASGTVAVVSPTPPPAPSNSESLPQLRVGDMGPYYSLYGGYRSPCPPEDTSCNATGVNTAIKTFLDQTCEGPPTSEADVCHHRTYDGEYGVFTHKLKSFPGAVRKRIGEACEYGPDSSIRSGRLQLGAGTLALCIEQ